MFSSEEYDKRINGLMREAGMLPNETDDENAAVKQMQMAEEELIRMHIESNVKRQHEQHEKRVARLANETVRVMYSYLYAQGMDDLWEFDKADVLRRISKYLEEKAMSIMGEGDKNDGH